MSEKVYFGTELKVAINITGHEFSMADNDFMLLFRCGNNVLELAKADLIQTEDTWLAIIDTAELGIGKVTMTAHAYIEDATMRDGLRTEVTKCDVCVINPA